ncbi:MAG: NAD(P)-dependent oxidoreductase [Eubacterium sp.]|nr:NAD(P)-dependent oxidoreductase [Eubacterium sp.]
MRNIIITGATSFIGIHLINELLKNEVCIYAVIRPQSNNRSRLPIDSRINVIELEMEEYDRLPDLIEKADHFYHLAWQGTRVPLRDDILIQRKNYECAVKAFEAATEMGCTLFLGTGSQAEYGKMVGAVNEETLCNPLTEYGKRKLETCRELMERADEKGIRFVWIRLFSIYGPYDFQGTMVMSSIEKMLRNSEISMTEGIQLWDYLYVGDAVKAMTLLSENNNGQGVYNIASGDYKPLRSFVEIMKEVLHSDSKILLGAVPYGTQGPVDLTPDISKIKQMGWTPLVTFEQGIEEIIKQSIIMKQLYYN